MLVAGFGRRTSGSSPTCSGSASGKTDQSRSNLLRVGECFLALVPALNQICNHLSKIGMGFGGYLPDPTAPGKGDCRTGTV
jgi:hypothetical protein